LDDELSHRHRITQRSAVVELQEPERELSGYGGYDDDGRYGCGGYKYGSCKFGKCEKYRFKYGKYSEKYRKCCGKYGG
jgi:hypothetical protein